jgi:hypothetical protein
MFHRVVVKAIHMSAEILLVPDRMLPKALLPYTPLPFVQTAFGAAFDFRESARKGRLDLSPTG